MAIVTKGINADSHQTQVLRRNYHSAHIFDKRAMSWEHDVFYEPEGECVKDCLDFVEADLPPPKKGVTKQSKTEVKSCSHHVLNKSKKKVHRSSYNGD